MRKYMPITHIAFLVSCLAISGIPPFSGFFSKDEILSACFAFNPVMGWVMTIIAAMTAFYMFRLYYGIFWGTENKEYHAEHVPHEAPATMTVPLIILSVITLVAGWIPFGKFISSDGLSFSSHLELKVAITSVVIAVISILIARSIYRGEKQPVADKLQSKFQGLWTAAHRRFYIDEVYQYITHRIIFKHICHPIAWFDRHIVDGFMNFLAWSTNAVSYQVRGFQSGEIQQYAYVFLLGTLLLILLLIL
jgi:NADH-quinone oxidoreductase subunit L